MSQLFKCYILAGLLTLLAFAKQTTAQPEISVEDATKLAEKTVLITDRETYCVDEDILFSALNASSPQLRRSDWSNVIYIELITPSGEPIARRKYAYSEDGASGTLRIPSWTLTGIYYLRTYTRWMRDYSPYNYAYKPIRIINPFRPELLQPDVSRVIPEYSIAAPLNIAHNIILNLEQKNYSQRDTVNLKIQLESPEKYGDLFTVSVIRKGTEQELIPDLKEGQEFTFSPDFIPETRGLTISGKVVNEKDSVPLPYMLVGLTIFKKNPENLSVMTNKKGQFFFDLSTPEGEYETFISVKPGREHQRPLILVDNDFSTQKIELPYISMALTKADRERYQSLSFNSQLHALYRQQKKEEAVQAFSSDSSFYGNPDFILKLDKYIELPTLQDYIYELIPQVRVRHEGNRRILKVMGIYSDLAIYDPLVLVDMVPVFEVDRVLAIQPGKIDRIEVVNTPYIRGDIVFGGIISLFSTEGDLAGIDLPAAGRFIPYRMLNPDPADFTADSGSHHIPDIRNCLYWNPSLKLNGTNAATLSFSTGDNTGKYMIVIRGTDQTGKTHAAVTEINIE